MLSAMDLPLFDEVGEVVRGLAPPDLGPPTCRARRYGVKVWFGDDGAEHYEAQVIGARYAPDASVLALEVGFHLEHRTEADNAGALAALLSREKAWRRKLGAEAVAGPFLGRESWRRVSEVWLDPDLEEPGLALEVGARLVDYAVALEPLRRR
jgi:hypothetical protein